MPSRDWRLRLQDILGCIVKIERFTRGQSFDTFQANDMMVDAVLRNLEIIGEAAGHIPTDVQERHPHIPWREMRAMRNIVIHAYFGVSLPIVWDTVTGDLTPLPPLLTAILDHEP